MSGGNEHGVKRCDVLMAVKSVSVCLLCKGIDLVLRDIPTAGGKRSG